jgi:hypothetical protein
VGIITGWLENGNSSVQDRGIWGVGDGFIESCTFNATELSQLSLALDYFRADIVDRNFQQFANVSDALVTLRVCSPSGREGRGRALRHSQPLHLDQRRAPAVDPLLTTVTRQYEKQGAPVNGYYAGVFKDWDPAFPWKALVEGYDLLHLTSLTIRTRDGRLECVQDRVPTSGRRSTLRDAPAGG